MLLRPLYESWLLRSTRTPLAPWQRSLLLRALEKDEALRCLALELAEFSHEDEAPEGVNPPDLRGRLSMLAAARPAAAPPRWGLALAGALGVALGLGAFFTLQPGRPDVEVGRVIQPDASRALALPTDTPTPLPSGTPTPTPTATTGAAAASVPTATSTPTP